MVGPATRTVRPNAETHNNPCRTIFLMIWTPPRVGSDAQTWDNALALAANGLPCLKVSGILPLLHLECRRRARDPRFGNLRRLPSDADHVTFGWAAETKREKRPPILNLGTIFPAAVVWFCDIGRSLGQFLGAFLNE